MGHQTRGRDVGNNGEVLSYGTLIWGLQELVGKDMGATLSIDWVQGGSQEKSQCYPSWGVHFHHSQHVWNGQVGWGVGYWWWASRDLRLSEVWSSNKACFQCLIVLYSHCHQEHGSHFCSDTTLVSWKSPPANYSVTSVSRGRIIIRRRLIRAIGSSTRGCHISPSAEDSPLSLGTGVVEHSAYILSGLQLFQ